MTDPGLAAQPFVAGPNSVECSLREKLHAAQDAGEVAPDLEVSAEVAGLLAMSGGLGTSVLVGQRSADAALATLRYHLDRIFEKSAVSR